MTASRFIGFLAVTAVSVLLSACAGNDMQDLHQFIAEVKAREPGRIEPLPEIKPIETYVYVAGDRRDPFIASETSTTDTVPEAPGGIAPDPLRRKEELEAFPLDSIRMVGTLEQLGSIWGLVTTQDGTIFRVKPGNYMGQNHGQIALISDEKIDLTEIIPDGQGGYRERQASVALSE